MAEHFKQIEWEDEPRRHRVWPWVVLVVLLLAAAGVYAAGVVAFSEYYFMPNTTLDGEDVSLRRLDEVAAERSSALDDASYRLVGDGVDITVTGAQIGLAYDGESYVEQAVSASEPLSWPLSFTSERSLVFEEVPSFDEAKLKTLVQEVVDASTAAAEADGGTGLVYDEASQSFSFNEAFLPQLVDVDKVCDAVAAAIETGQTEVALGDEVLVGTADAQAVAELANSYLASAPTLTLGGAEAYVVTREQVYSWLVIGDDLSVSLDSAAIEEWCHGALSDLLDSVGTDRTYTRPDGKECTVSDGEATYGSSVYGWSIDGGSLAPLIVEAIQSGLAQTVEIPCYSSAAQVNPGGQDWGSRYIDVDISEQHARFYDADGSLIWEADITTGQPSEGYDTPTGVWQVTNKKDGDVNLKGPIDEETGEPEWDSHVNFWVGVVGNLVGFHNAPWQESMGFGGTIYTWYGSHGCMRMSYASAEALYALVGVGDVVVIHN